MAQRPRQANCSPTPNWRSLARATCRKEAGGGPLSGDAPLIGPVHSQYTKSPLTALSHRYLSAMQLEQYQRFTRLSTITSAPENDLIIRRSRVQVPAAPLVSSQVSGLASHCEEFWNKGCVAHLVAPRHWQAGQIVPRRHRPQSRPSPFAAARRLRTLARSVHRHRPALGPR